MGSVQNLFSKNVKKTNIEDFSSIALYTSSTHSKLYQIVKPRKKILQKCQQFQNLEKRKLNIKLLNKARMNEWLTLYFTCLLEVLLPYKTSCLSVGLSVVDSQKGEKLDFHAPIDLGLEVIFKLRAY